MLRSIACWTRPNRVPKLSRPLVSHDGLLDRDAARLAKPAETDWVAGPDVVKEPEVKALRFDQRADCATTPVLGGPSNLLQPARDPERRVDVTGKPVDKENRSPYQAD